MKETMFEQLIRSLDGSISYLSDVSSHEMIYMTPAAMELFGLHSTDDYIGRKCYQLLHGADRPCAFCTNSRISEEDTLSWIQYNRQLKKWMSVQDRLELLGQRKCRLETMQEINGRRQWQSDVINRLNTETILLQCIQTLSSSHITSTSISSFLEMLGRFYCADRAYIMEFDESMHTFSNTFAWCAEGVESNMCELQHIPADTLGGWLEQLRENGESSILLSAFPQDNEPVLYSLLRKWKVQQLTLVSLFFNGALIGFIGVDNPVSNHSQLNLLRATSDFVAIELDKRRMMETLEYLSYTDTLTKVFNRHKFNRDLSAHYQSIPQQLGIILVNINGLNGINSTFGQQYGDTIIIRTAQILKDCSIPYLYRIGGDEFLLACPNCQKEEFLDLVEHLRKHFRTQPECSVSIGSAWKSSAVDIDSLILQADEQMRAEKQTYYHTSYTDNNIRHANSATDVLEEIEAGHFKVYYQPKVDLRSKRIVGAEALVRKVDPDGNLIPPGRFIPHYEARNVLIHVDLHVLDTALSTVRILLDKGCDLYMSVNFSRSTLIIPNFVDTVLSLCKKHRVPPTSLMLEVTETISTIDRDQLRDLLHSIRKAGLRLSLDDFGAKYSNTSILADIEFDEVKLDKTLVDDICLNHRSRTILKSLTSMCRDLENTIIVAEGIETLDQATLLEQFSCDYGQGFHFYRPMPLDQFLPLL